MLFPIALPVLGPDGVQHIEGSHGLIDETGAILVPPTHRLAGVLGDRLGYVSIAGEGSLADLALVDDRGREIGARRWRQIGGLRDGLLAVREDGTPPGGGGETTFVDVEGREVVRVATDAFDLGQVAFSEGRCAVFRGGQWGYVNRRGELVIPCRYDMAGPFSEGLAAVTVGELTGYLTPDGAWAIEPRFLRAWGFTSSGVAAAVATMKEVDGPMLRELKKDFSVKELRGMWGLIDRSGAWVKRPTFDHAETELHTSMGVAGGGLGGPLRLVEDRAIVRQKKAWGVIDGQGNAVVEPKLLKVGDFADGLAAFQKKVIGRQRWGLLDRQGRTVVEPRFLGAPCPRAAFVEGLAPFAVELDPDLDQARRRFGQFGVGSWGYVDRKGDFVIPPELVFAWPFERGLARVQGVGFWGYLDRAGRPVWRTELVARN